MKIKVPKTEKEFEKELLRAFENGFSKATHSYEVNNFDNAEAMHDLATFRYASMKSFMRSFEFEYSFEDLYPASKYPKLIEALCPDKVEASA